ncbi:MAG: elongation factor G [Clostridiales bacterium]|jgi:elongation factor G|nr:elongation factor G [Clostridiales bacterium]
MAKFQSSQIRNICLLGHGGDGKTSLTEAMLYLAKATDRLGKTSDGNTVSDFDPEEISRGISISTSLSNFVWNGKKINILDTPGYLDFVGEIKQAISVTDSCIFVVDAKSGLKVGTELCWEYAGNLPKAVFVNKIDDENAHFENVFNSLRETFGSSVCPVFVPFGEGTPDMGFYNLLTEKAYKFDKAGKASECELPGKFADKMEEFKQIISESLAETSEDLMEKFFAEEPFTHEEMIDALNKGLYTGTIAPVFAGSATSLAGVSSLMDMIASSFVSPVDREKHTAIDDSGNATEITLAESGETALFVFKTAVDNFGKKSFFKVMNGTLKKDVILLNKTSGQSEKIARILTCVGKKETETDELAYGDMGYTVKLVNTNTCATLASNGFTYRFPEINYPVPYLCMAMVPKAKGDEDKISSGIAKLMEEDRTIKYENSMETKQICLYGLGEAHLSVITSRLKSRFGASVDLETPKVAYRETIKKKSSVEAKHKKQTGGHGQYGHVKIEFSPGEKEELEFTETVFGGAVPRNYFPAVEKGLQESMAKGILAGYPVIRIKANLFDGSYHPVDSSEMAFKLAANMAFKEGMKQCNPVLLEPIGSLKVLIPTSMSGDIMGDLNKRRGRIMGMNEADKKGYTVIEAEVPMAEMLTYAIQLRAMTQGRGSYTFEFTRYEETPSEVAAKVIETAKKNAEEE